MGYNAIHCLDSLFSMPTCRIHGQVPRHAVRWRTIPEVHKERLRDIIYEKGQSEGIAKVC